MNITVIVGARVKDARKRCGLTQQELARLSRVSVSLVRKLEQGDYAGGLRLETLHRIAVVLDVTTTALMSEPDAAGPERDSVTLWEPVRLALDGRHGSEPDGAPSIGGLRDGVSDAVAAFVASRYSQIRVALPALLRDADALAGSASPGAVLRARQVRCEIRQLAAQMLGQAWQFDAAHRAIGLAGQDADDQPAAMAVANCKCWLLMREGRLSASQELAARWAGESEPRRISAASRDELAGWGLSLIRVSNAAVRDNRPDEAREALRLAKMAAAGMGSDMIPRDDPWSLFGPVTVATIGAENAMIQGRPEVTLSIGSQVAGRAFPAPRYYHRHRLDMASAYAATRKLDEAVGVLTEIRSAAPEWLVQQRYARDILTSVITRKRRLSDETRELADFMSLPA